MKNKTITLENGSTIENVVSVADHQHPLMHAFCVVTYTKNGVKHKKTVAKQNIVSNQ